MFPVCQEALAKMTATSDRIVKLVHVYCCLCVQLGSGIQRAFSHMLIFLLNVTSILLFVTLYLQFVTTTVNNLLGGGYRRKEAPAGGLDRGCLDLCGHRRRGYRWR